MLFLPSCYSKYIYKFDTKELELKRFVTFKYDDRFYSENDMKSNGNTNLIENVYKYLQQSSKRIPVLMSYDKGKFYIAAESVKKGYDMYIVDFETKQTRSLPYRINEKTQFMRPSFVSDGILYASNTTDNIDSLINAFPGKVTEVNKYNADSTVNDNIAVLKYHLK